MERSKKPSVILYKALPDDLLQRLQEHFTVHGGKPQPTNRRTKCSNFAEAEGFTGFKTECRCRIAGKMPKLRATSTISVGCDNFDVDALTARKILLMHTPTVLTETVADTLMALVFVYRSSGCGGSRTGKSRRMDREHRPGLVRH